MAGMSNDGSTNINMADPTPFFAPPATPGDVSYEIIGEIPDDWEVGLDQPVDGMDGLAFPQMVVPFQAKQARTSLFDRLDEELLGKIFDYVGAKWNGLMPNMIIALRQSPIAYKLVLQYFINTNKFVLCPGNNWSLGGMPPSVIGRIKNLELAVCVCNLTDGDNTWVMPEETWCPKKKGLSSIETVTVYPSNIIHNLPHISKLPAALIEHPCLKSEKCVTDYLYRFPIFLRPFENLRSTTVYTCITPWVRINKTGHAAEQLRLKREATNRRIGFASSLEQKIDTRVGQIAGQKWVWTVEEGNLGINWGAMWKDLVPKEMHDLSDMVDWDACGDNTCKAQ